jgi:glutathione S-transferase
LVRYVLNFKKLPYKTVSLEYPDVEGEFKKFEIPASTTKPDGTPLYTCPSIIDKVTKTAVTDSYKITEYLDKQYPDSPRAIPKGTEALQAAFYDQFWQLVGPVFPFILPHVPALLNPPSAEYFEKSRAAYFGKPLSELAPKGEEAVEKWKKVQEAFDTLHGWLSKSSGPYFMGETVTFADFVVAASLKCLRICLGPDSKEWKEIMERNDGRWEAFWDSLEQYASEEN